MTAIHYLKFIALILFAYVFVYAVQIPIRKKEHKVLAVFLWLMKWVLIICLAYLLIAYASPFMWHFGYAVAALYLALLGDVFSDAVSVFLRNRVRHENRKYTAGFMTLAVSLYAIVNMHIILPNYHTYTSRKLNHTYKVVFIADLHYGSSQRANTVMKALNKIREENPDYLLLGGDIVDEHTEKKKCRKFLHRSGTLVSLHTTFTATMTGRTEETILADADIRKRNWRTPLSETALRSFITNGYSRKMIWCF